VRLVATGLGCHFSTSITKDRAERPKCRRSATIAYRVNVAQTQTAMRTGLAAALTRARARVRRWPGGWLLWRVTVTLIGLVVIAVGAILIPLPGPGWLIVFLGLGIWSTEYAWARRLLAATRRIVGRWWAWLTPRPRWLKVVVGVLGLAFTVAVSFAAWSVF
jgi:uncharacterized protein (TIGR02611 family)